MQVTIRQLEEDLSAARRRSDLYEAELRDSRQTSEELKRKAVEYQQRIQKVRQHSVQRGISEVGRSSVRYGSVWGPPANVQYLLDLNIPQDSFFMKKEILWGENFPRLSCWSSVSTVTHQSGIHLCTLVLFVFRQKSRGKLRWRSFCPNLRRYKECLMQGRAAL